ncbi:MAG: 30S ribosomal protein S6 [bacterium]|nr:30S ribosomal protein S6 [bacterium]
MSKEMEKTGEETKLYELGYLFSPLVPVEDVAVAISKSIKEVIEALGGKVVDGLDPKMNRLTYTISKSVEHRRTSYSEAYFGAIRFNLWPGSLASLEEKFKLDASILRYTIISLPKDANKIIIPKRPLLPRKRVLTRVDKPTEPVTPMTEEAIDKEIEGLLTKAA